MTADWREQMLARCWYCTREIVLYRLTMSDGTDSSSWYLALWQKSDTTTGEAVHFVTYGSRECTARDNVPRIHDPMPPKGDLDALSLWLDAPSIAPPQDQSVPAGQR